MNKICTTVKQSKKLMELGIDVNTADMYWWYNGQRYYVETKEHNDFQKSDVYAWSLAALLNAIDFSTINLHYNNERTDWVASATIHDSTKHCTKYESTRALNPVDACYEMIIKLHEL